MASSHSVVVMSILAFQALAACAPDASQQPETRQLDEVDAIRQADLAWAAAQAEDGLEGTMSV